ncbi:MAG: hypothetical protein WCK28_17030 [Burkholderiales bacterium]|jgi:hypothetical protein
MALADYRLCDMCESKAFYDSDLSYENGPPGHDPEQPPFRTAGSEQWGTPEQRHKYGTRLGNLGDWAVLCTDCAKTNRTLIVPLDTPPAKGAR